MARRVRRGRGDVATTGPFVALDFETANRSRASACAVAAVRVEEGRIAGEYTTRLHLPPGESFEFTHVHGIGPAQIRSAPSFSEAWARVEPLLAGARFLVAHNASFDRSVLLEVCAAGRVPVPRVPFLCTVRLARSLWRIRPTTLPDVCRRLGIPLRHHDPLSDARAAALTVVRAMEDGWGPESSIEA